jgi:hypothetical protein
MTAPYGAPRAGKLGFSVDGPVSLEGFLAESLACGLLQAFDIREPPVPVRDMIRAPHPAFGPLSLLELNLGLYDAAYRSLLNGSRLIAVDSDRPDAVQREGMARELYVAFCRSRRASELDWPDREDPRHRSDYFARCLLMPADWVRHFASGSRSLGELSVIFGVTTEMMADRLRELGIE